MVEEQSSMASLSAAKQQLRSLMKQRLGAIPHESAISQSRVVSNTLKTFKPYVEAKRVSVFLSMPSGEIQTDAIVRNALASGKEVFVPYLHRNPLPSHDLPARVMDMVRLKDLRDYESLKPDRWGIPSIDPATVHERERIFGGPDAQHSDQIFLDLILMPGVAFDRDPQSGAIRRLGHGKGFYDYFINRHKAKLSTLGMQEHPVGPLDQPLDGLILGNGDVESPTENKTA
jgi:5-formyltetrahydrofolate cyclo-ligase